MRHASPFTVRNTALVAGLLSLTLAGCRPTPPEAPPTPVPQPPVAAAPAAALPGGSEETAATHAAVSAPSSADTPAMPQQPDVATMRVALDESAKIGVPVELRYQVDGDAQDGRAVTVHLAAVPSIAGSNLSVSLKQEPLLQASAAPLVAQKAAASTAYRQELSVTRLAGAPAELRVLVSMETAEGLAFSWFGVPLTQAAAIAKQASREMH